jgi:hypothetical protein
VVRAAGGALYFDSDGLCVDGIDDGSGSSIMAVASRVPRPSPRLRGTSRNRKN